MTYNHTANQKDIKVTGCFGSFHTEISHRFMEMFLNLIYFTDFYFIEILIGLFWFFFQRSIFHSHCYLKLTLFKLQNYHEFSRFFLCSELYRFGDINHLDLTNFKFKPNTKHFLRSTWLIHFDGLCNYLYSFQRLLAACFFININCYFSDKEKVGHQSSKFTETFIH